MPLSDIQIKKQQGTRCVNQQYVFFCEGSTEKLVVQTILRELQKNGTNINIYSYIVPDINNGFFFTPQKMLDYYLEMKKSDPSFPWPYNDVQRPSTVSEQENSYTHKICNLVKNDETKICLLVDTDVFFKNVSRNYDNLRDEDNNILQQDVYNETRISLLDRFKETPNVQNQEYKFLEQELNFEDFFILFFMDDDTYKKWFRSRFGDPNINCEERDIRCYYNGDYGNAQNGYTIKRLFDETVGIEDFNKGWFDTWIRNNIPDTESWHECINRAIERVNKNINWPRNFGLIDFMKNIEENNNER